MISHCLKSQAYKAMLCLIPLTTGLSFICVIPEKIHTLPMVGHWQFLVEGGGGVLKAKFLEAIYENKLEFPGRGGAKQNSSVGGVWIFSGTAHLVVSNQQL